MSIWNDPKTWGYKDVFTATEGNEMSDNLRYLKKPSRDFKDLKGMSGVVAALTTTLAAVDDTNLLLSLTTYEANEDVFFTLNGSMSLATAAQYLYFDVLVDNTWYASSGTGVALANNLFPHYMTTNAIVYLISYTKKIIIPTAGVHTFKLRARVSTTGTNLTLSNANSNWELGVRCG